MIEKEQDEVAKALSDETRSKNSTLSQNLGTNTKSRDTKYQAGINYYLFDSPYFDTFLDTGLKLDLPLNPFGKLRFQKDYKNRIVDIYAAQKFILYRQEGFLEVTQLSFYKEWNKLFQNELINSLLWTDATDVFVLRNNLIFYHNIGNEKHLSLSLGANAEFIPVTHYSSYDASISYRQLLYSKWLYGFVATGAEFPKANNFEPEKFIQFRVEIFFR